MSTSPMEMNENKRATFLVASNYVLMKIWMTNNFHFLLKMWYLHLIRYIENILCKIDINSLFSIICDQIF